MSIADGQVVLERDSADASSPVGVDVRLSVSRIGSRAYPPALAALAPSIRLQLAQVLHSPCLHTSLLVAAYVAADISGGMHDDAAQSAPRTFPQFPQSGIAALLAGKVLLRV